MNYKILFKSFFLFFGLNVIAQNRNGQADNVDYLLNQANEKIANKDYKGAIEDCEAAEAVCPNCSSPIFQKMNIYGIEKKFTDAEREFKRACKLSKNIKENLRNEIQLDYHKGRMNDVYKKLQNEIDKDSVNMSSIFWYSIRASYYAGEKKYKLAYQDYCKTYFLNPNFLRPLSLMIIHEIHVKQKDKYEEHMKTYTFNNLNKDSITIYFNKGLFAYYLKDYHQANSYFDSSLAIKKDNRRVLVFKALSLALLNNFDTALVLINKALVNQKNNSYTINNRGFIYLLAGKYDCAIADFEKAILLYDKQSEPYNNLAYIYSKTNPQKSKEYQEKAVKIGGDEYIPYWKLD